TRTNGTTYTDPTSSTPALTQSGNNYTYTDASGNPQTVAVITTQYTVSSGTWTGQCFSYNYGPQNLTTTVTYPDGTNYQITYEPSFGETGHVTGRIKTIKLPTGATITYNYNGTNHGFSCEDDGTSGFTRTTPDGTWTYSRAKDSNQWVTTVTAPGGQTYTSKFTGTAPYYRVSYDAKA